MRDRRKLKQKKSALAAGLASGFNCHVCGRWNPVVPGVVTLSYVEVKVIKCECGAATIYRRGLARPVRGK
jgi:hypothetical protein